MQVVKQDQHELSDFPGKGCLVILLTEHPPLSRDIAIVGEQPEALILSILLAEAEIPNYLVGHFGESVEGRNYKTGIEEALWLLAVHQRSRRIKPLADVQQVPFAEVRNVVIASHVTAPQESNKMEIMIRNIAPNLLAGSNLIFTGLCRPYYTSTVLKETIEKYSGLKIGSDIGLFYLPLFWAGEPIQAFREEPKIVAGIGPGAAPQVQERLIRVFPSMSWAPKIAAAEAAGLFKSLHREVMGALGLELAKISETQGIDYDEVLGLCRGSGLNELGLRDQVSVRDSIGSAIALSATSGKSTSQLVRAARRINENYQSQVLQMIKYALARCGRQLRRSKIAIIGLDGLLRNTWSKPEPLQILQSLRKRGAYISVYPGETQVSIMGRIVGSDIRVESNLLKAVADANCAVVALRSSLAGEVDPKKLALEMRLPGAVCDLSRVLEASNVEQAGLFYTSIGRGTMNS
jgi:UDP-N-acetyl-D-mannosaminuronate dehydrogenase